MACIFVNFVLLIKGRNSPVLQNIKLLDDDDFLQKIDTMEFKGYLLGWIAKRWLVSNNGFNDY